MHASVKSTAMKFYAGANGSYKFDQMDNLTGVVPISYYHLYGYRGEEVENPNRNEYFSENEVQK